MLSLTLYAKPGCHLCDEARDVVDQVLGEFDGRVTLEEIDITEDARLQRKYGEEIPVVFVGERKHSQWQVDPARLRDRIRTSLEETA